MSALTHLLEGINARMNGGACPTTGCIGECAMVTQVTPGLYMAMLYIWNGTFNDSATVAAWFREHGAASVNVSLTLYSDENGDRDGKTVDGVREWAVYFTLPTTETPARHREARVIGFRPGMGEVTLYVEGGVPGFMDIGHTIYVSAALPAPPASEQQTAAYRDVLAERRRQVEDEQWTPEHDDRYRHRQLAMAAACYAAAVPVHDVLDYSDGKIENRVPVMPSAWPWARAWWKPGTARQNLVKAGALILAEIERLDRATATGLPAGRPSEAEGSQP